MKVIANLICQNAISEIRRSIESVAPYVDEFHVMDGGSSDYTWEMLKEWKDIYHLTLHHHNYDEQGAQRNRLLYKMPKNVWILNIDQDEEMNYPMKTQIREYIDRISPDLYVSDKRTLPLTLQIRNINLVQDLNHYDADNVKIFAIKAFYNDRNLHFTPGYHTSICYFDTENNTNAVPTPDDWCIKHYAYLDQKRIKESFKDKKRSYKQSEWDSHNWKITELPKSWI